MNEDFNNFVLFFTVLISYCVDSENKQITKPSSMKSNSSESVIATASSASYAANTYQYTLADVPRLAEYSASMYASNSAEHEHYVKYYTQYYMTEITKGQYGNLPTMNQLSESSANSGAAVALSAMQRKQNKYRNSENSVAAVSTTATSMNSVATAMSTVTPVNTPKGNDGKKYRKFICYKLCKFKNNFCSD